MKKLDKLIIKSFLATFALTFCVVVFILLNRQLLFYYDDIIGKGLGWIIIGKFIGYFAAFMIPQALPLSILLASLICFGNLGEHGELTAIKAAGVSLTRIIQPVFTLVVFITAIAFACNNYVVPRAALNAFALLYDIRQTKPALEIREGEFYTGLPGISLKVDRKFNNDDAALKGVMLYDHRDLERNRDVYVADSGRMTTVLNEQYLQFELFNGVNYKEDWAENEWEPALPSAKDDLSRVNFEHMEILVDLSSFDFKKSDLASFSGHRYMKNLSELDSTISKLEWERRTAQRSTVLTDPLRYRSPRAPIVIAEELQEKPASRDEITLALNRVRQSKVELENFNAQSQTTNKELNGFKVQWHRILAYSFACIAMFLIGAPLGAIIKKGGLGIPFLVAVCFFILFFIFDMQGEKLSNRGIIPASVGIWSGNTFLLLLGLAFLHIARIDGRLFELDVYTSLHHKFKSKLRMRKPAHNQPATGHR